MRTKRCNTIILGAGQAGVPLARAMAGAGCKTILVEKEHIGGTCLNEGCTPTKTMVASARVAYLARRAADYGVQTGPIRIEMEVVRRRKREIVNNFVGSNLRRLEDAEVEIVWGEGRFSGPLSLEVELNEGGKVDYSADTVIINTGSRPHIPEIPGLETVPYLNSTTIMELAEVPSHLMIIGGGYIGLEFGQMFRRFGSQVSIVQRGEQLLGREDEDVAAAVLQIMQEDGLRVLLNSTPQQVSRAADGDIELVVRTQEGECTLKGSHLLVAAGRVPNTDRLDPQAAGVQVDGRGYVQVDERLRTTATGVYAAGDVKGGPAFTHISYDDYRVLKYNLLNNGQTTIAGRPVPYVVFIDPQLGRIGLSEKQAREQGLDVQVAKIPMNWVARALEVDESRGLMKAIVDSDTDRILGFTMLGVEAGEIMSAVQIAMLGDLPYTVLREGIFAHPTLMEALNTLFGQL